MAMVIAVVVMGRGRWWWRSICGGGGMENGGGGGGGEGAGGGGAGVMVVVRVVVVEVVVRWGVMAGSSQAGRAQHRDAEQGRRAEDLLTHGVGLHGAVDVQDVVPDPDLPRVAGELA
eukprot:7185754-Alexandrium_andersonii.AAC.1